MRYLILSDIHANITAFETVLEAAEGRWDKAVCLGDLVGYGPDPNEVIDRVRELPAVTIRGNHDKAVTGLANPEEFNPLAQNAVLWTREQLRPENFDYLVNLPKGPVPAGAFSIIHGALHDEDEYVFAPEQALTGLLDAPTPVVFFGHTHIQGGFTLRGEEMAILHSKPATDKRSSVLTVEPDVVYLLNPGSIGQPRDGDPRAAFAIADLENQRVEFWRLPYDIQSVQQRMAQAGLPEPLILRLTFGR
ncbi:MAG: metallophosphoesterase family protein [Candidatus Acidiferrales bacterium]|jgi:predicted phosphodiesterase